MSRSRRFTLVFTVVNVLDIVGHLGRLRQLVCHNFIRIIVEDLSSWRGSQIIIRRPQLFLGSWAFRTLSVGIEFVLVDIRLECIWTAALAEIQEGTGVNWGLFAVWSGSIGLRHDTLMSAARRYFLGSSSEVEGSRRLESPTIALDICMLSQINLGVVWVNGDDWSGTLECDILGCI